MARILVVDDDAGFRATVARMLGRLGHEVQLADGAEAGLHLFRSMPADVVLMDVFMPGTDGVETTRQLTSLSPRTPVVATSGGGLLPSEMALSLAGHSGAFTTLPKPFTLEELRGTLDQVLQSGAARGGEVA